MSISAINGHNDQHSLLEQLQQAREKQAASAASTSADGISRPQVSGKLATEELLSSKGAVYAGEAPEETARHSGTYALENTQQGQKVVYSPLKKADIPRTVASTQVQSENLGSAENLASAAEEEPPAASSQTKDIKAPAKATGPEKSDDPAKAEDPEKEDKEQKTVCNTDAVDREIKNLKKKVQQLTNQVSTANDEAKAADLEKELTRAQMELANKDNDSYRKQHASFRNIG